MDSPTLEFKTDASDEPSFDSVITAQPAPKQEIILAEKQDDSNLAEIKLSPEEMKQVEEFSKKIDITNSAGIMNYGVGTQKKLADFSERTLADVRTKDMGEVGAMITGLVTELKGFDVGSNEKGFLSFFKRKMNKLEALKS